MEIRSKIIDTLKIIFKYLVSNKIMSVVALYFVISLFLKMAFEINILIPCLWKTIFNIECPGCGLTTAFIDILQCNITGAFKANPLIFIVLPLGIFYIYKDFKKFSIHIKNTETTH